MRCKGRAEKPYGYEAEVSQIALNFSIPNTNFADAAACLYTQTHRARGEHQDRRTHPIQCQGDALTSGADLTTLSVAVLTNLTVSLTTVRLAYHQPVPGQRSPCI